MPRLTPTELQEARRRSGRLGGRPRKPTVEEPRAAALEQLVPKSIQVLQAHLGEGDEVNPHAWRAALRVFEHAFGKAPEQVEEIDMPESIEDLDKLSSDQLDYLRRRILGSTRGSPPSRPKPRRPSSPCDSRGGGVDAHRRLRRVRLAGASSAEA